MLTIIYKIISKIIANRLKLLIPQLVDDQQTGFVHGNSITDNLLAYHLAEEFARLSKQRIAFLKVDFVKAFDRVDHTFIWDTMGAMGFNARFLHLIRGLVEGGNSKVHINGFFTDDIQLQRGVRQGCSITAFLFSLTTQPLMSLLARVAQLGELHRLRISGNR